MCVLVLHLALECQFKVDVFVWVGCCCMGAPRNFRYIRSKHKLMIHSTTGVCPRSPEPGLEGSQLCHKLEDTIQVI